MKLHNLAHSMVWSVGVFAFVYLVQSLFIMEFGVRTTATLLFLLLIISAVYGVISIREFHKRNMMGMMSFGMITLFITTLLILTRLQYFGVFLLILYSGIAIARIFKLIETERAEARARRAQAQPPADLPF